jgi:TRAP-type mannitol/chloroaromatic compound transport system substrate-binding protein
MGASAGAAMAIPEPAAAQDLPEIKWRLVSSFPKSLDTIFGGANVFAQAIAEVTNGRFNIEVFGPGEIVPALQVLDAVSNGTVELGHTATFYFVGKDPTFALAAGLPFGPNQRQHQAWLYHGGGYAKVNEFLHKYNVHGIPAIATGCQMGGWFRKEINSVEDLKGLKMRIAGLAGKIWQKLGAVPQQLPGGDVYPALERGVIDAAEWIGPYDDEKLGFYKVAPYYYYPGWWECSGNGVVMVNLEKWNALPDAYRKALHYVGGFAMMSMVAQYDALNPAALKRLVADGARLRAFPPEVMQAFARATDEVCAEISLENAEFKAFYNNLRAFRDDSYLWWQVAEHSYDYFAIKSLRKD